MPGAARLIRALRVHQPSRVTILSGSPEQMRGTLESKLRLDGIVWDEFTLKPSVRNILRLRFRALRDQVGYKLPALLDARTRVPQGVPETLFGDDAEADALVYSLYADVLAGKVSDRQLTAVLEQSRTYADVVSEIIRLVHRTARGDVVRRIFIHLDRRSDPGFFRIYGPASCRSPTTSRPPRCCSPTGSSAPTCSPPSPPRCTPRRSSRCPRSPRASTPWCAGETSAPTWCSTSPRPSATAHRSSTSPQTSWSTSPTPFKTLPLRESHRPRWPSTTSTRSPTTAPAGRPPATRHGCG
nr:hypothetical protein [Deltaproteobacteria bacterium]